MSDEKKKIKILVLADSPTAATGFAQVSRNILSGLAKTGRYQIDVLGINYGGDFYDRDKFPYSIYPAMPQGSDEMYGRNRLMSALSGEQAKFGLQNPWDIVFTIQDPFVLEGLGLNYPFAEQLRVTSELWRRTLPPEFWFKWVGYWPVDAAVKENWVTRSIALPDYPVAYCDWGRQQMLRWDREKYEILFNMKIKVTDESRKAKLAVPSLLSRVSVIHHGVDVSTFKPIPEDERKEFRKKFFSDQVKEDAFLVVNISRNQPRKDVTRTIAAFAEFHKKVPNSYLYLHMKAHDAGGSVYEMARNFELEPGKDFSLPEDFNAGVGYTPEIVNKIYNAADLCITTTLGEGWGFITTEAMATKTPIIAPNITSMLDIFDSHDFDYSEKMLEESDKLRGVPAKSGSTSSEWICLGLEDNERIRPLTNVEDLVSKMIWVYSHPKAVEKIVNRAYKWVTELSWNNIVNQWVELFDKAYDQLEKDRELGRTIDKTNRNDPCPCGSGLKFKKCHGSENNLDKLNSMVVPDEEVAKIKKTDSKKKPE